MTKSVTRLYNYFKPDQYGLALNINKEAMTFSGRVTIRGKKVGKPTKRLTFHQKGLKITNASVIKQDKKGVQQYEIGRINNQDSYDEVRLHSEAPFYPGDYIVTIDFEGHITKAMNGIYPCFYEHDGQEKKLIATQFESHFARNAFPCIDEPEAKATFDMTLISPVGETVLGNTPIKEHSEEGAVQINTFETTPKMSTYLVAFVMGEMGYEEATTKSGTVIRSFATPDNAKFTASSVQDAVKILEFFEDYFAVPYPLQKLDMVALPDFTVGAMENWGLMTFRESILLVDPKSTSIESRQVSALVICHELSHQWFGNLVTMKWWDDLWLNESFANMMEYRGIDEIFPEWNIWEQFVSHEGVSAKRRDSLEDVQSVQMPINHPDEIDSVIDPSIVYAKGGTLLYMLMNHIGEDSLRKGLQQYFQKHQYGNTVAADLWQALTEVSGQDIAAIMKNWLTTSGYPVIHTEWQPGSTKIALYQERLLSDSTATDTIKTMWQVPLASSIHLSEKLLTTSKAVLDVEDSEKPLLLNNNGTSYFVPHYTNQAHLDQIKHAINNDAVSTINRLLLLDNYILLQRAGIATTVELLELTKCYTNETSENVWGLLAMSIGEARRLIDKDDAANDKLDTLVRDLVLPLLPTYGWDDKPKDSAQTLRMRGMVYSLAAGAKDKSTIDTALERFRSMNKPSDLSASTRGVSYFAAARHGTKKDFDSLIKLFETISSHDEKDEIASGFTSTKDPKQIKTILDYLKTKHIRNQDLPHMVAWMLRNIHARPTTWKWMQSNWTWLVEELHGDKQYDTLPRYSASVFSHADEQADYQKFFEPMKSEVALNRAIVLGEQEIIGRVAWRERNEKAVKKYFS